MATRTVMADGTTEDELRRNLNRAVADTEEEIFQEAIGDTELDNDGDRSLEEMGEGLEGDEPLDDEDVEDEDDTEVDAGADEALVAQPAEGEEEEGAEGEEGDGEEGQPQGRTDQQQPEGRVPPERLRAEAERRRSAESEATELRRQVAEANGRLDELSRRVNAQPQAAAQQQQPAPKPDMFADPEGYERWVLEQADRRADERFNQRFGAHQREQQARQEEYVNQSFAQAAGGDRGWEFHAAYTNLTRLDPKSPQARAVVAGIVNSPDPVNSLFNWWEDNGGPEYRDGLLEQLSPRQARGRQQQQPRHEVRLPPGIAPRRQVPSLNSAGGGKGQLADPDMLDDSDDAVMRYAMR